MGKIKAAAILAAAAVCVLLTGTSTSAGEFLRGAAYFSAGAISAISADSGSDPESGEGEASDSAESGGEPTASQSSAGGEEPDIPEPSEAAESSDVPETSVPQEAPPETPRGTVITKNRPTAADDTDYSRYTANSGAVYRYDLERSDAPDVITLSSGAQLRNCTDRDNGELLEASAELPRFWGDAGFEAGSDEPLVLIYHTHTSESFLPYGDSYDSEYPLRSDDPARNITAVGDAICEALAEYGISSIHDCTVHDSPMFTGAYYRSAETLLRDIEEYPTVKLAIDVHRDGIINEDGSVTAPTVVINGKNAAQFMIITGCDSEESPIPDYMENFRAACLIQNSAGLRYPGLARSVLFDYRNYNQSLFGGDMLIEVGSQGSSLDEAIYTGELLGEIIAKALLGASG